ncbi:hypothetical protein D8S78_06825 [Natrialba swarupiae]|nr:hypothetical protein [Natrialba swarupiae]
MGTVVSTFASGFMAFAGFTGVARDRSPRFDRWAERHSPIEKMAIVALFVFLAYMIWEDAGSSGPSPGALATFYRSHCW